MENEGFLSPGTEFIDNIYEVSVGENLNNRMTYRVGGVHNIGGKYITVSAISYSHNEVVETGNTRINIYVTAGDSKDEILWKILINQSCAITRNI